MSDLNEVRHTPLPWKYCGCGKCGMLHSVSADLYLGSFVSYDRDLPTPGYHEKAANARFVELAVNTHYVMLDALRAAFDYLDSTLSPCDPDCSCILHEVESVIALVEGI